MDKNTGPTQARAVSSPVMPCFDLIIYDLFLSVLVVYRRLLVVGTKDSLSFIRRFKKLLAYRTIGRRTAGHNWQLLSPYFPPEASDLSNIIKILGHTSN